MSDLLTHWAVFDDTRRLASQDPQMEPFILGLLDQERDIARLGAITRFGSRWVPDILKTLREHKSETEADGRLRKKAAFAVGGILHFPADQVFKPLMRELSQAEWDAAHALRQGPSADSAAAKNTVSVREISAYYDSHVFRRVYLAGNEEPFSHFLLTPNSTEPGQALEAFIRTLFQRTLLSSHTLAPDMQDFDGWLDTLFDKLQPLYVDINLYTRVFTSPDPAKILAFRVESEFYNDSDPLILMARAAQCGTRFLPDELENALQEGANQSGYAECLRMGMNLLRRTSAFWRGDSDAAEPPDVKQNTKWRIGGKPPAV